MTKICHQLRKLSMRCHHHSQHIQGQMMKFQKRYLNVFTIVMVDNGNDRPIDPVRIVTARPAGAAAGTVATVP